MLAVVQPAPIGLRLTERGSAYLRFVEFRGSLDVVHFRYGPSVHLPQLPTPPRGDAVEVVFRREQPNSTDGTRTHVQASFPGASSVCSCLIPWPTPVVDIPAQSRLGCRGLLRYEFDWIVGRVSRPLARKASHY